MVAEESGDLCVLKSFLQNKFESGVSLKVRIGKKFATHSSVSGIPQVFSDQEWLNLTDRGTHALCSRQSHQVTTNVRWSLYFDVVVFVT